MATTTIEVKSSESNFITPLSQIAYPGGKIKFHTDGGEFSIRIKNAISFLNIPESDLKVIINGTTNPDSPEYSVRNVDADINEEINIYSKADDKWPEAPPKIIIVANQ